MKVYVALAIFVAAFGAYMSNGRTLQVKDGFDTIPNRLLPFSILHYRTITLDPFLPDFRSIGGPREYIQERRGAYVSFYPVGVAPIASIPYAFAYVALRLRFPDLDHSQLFEASEWVEKFSAAAIAAAAASLLFVFLTRRTSLTIAAATAGAFAFCTLMWCTASQQLWQHGPVVLCLMSALCLLESERSWAITGAGLALGLSVATRPQTIVFVVAAFAFLVLKQAPSAKWRLPALLFSCAALVPIALSVAYSLYFFGRPLAGYSAVQGELRLATAALGLPGLLISPNRGLLVFTPIAFLGLAGAARAIAEYRRHQLLACFSVAGAAYLVMHASFYTWAGGWTFGPRYTIELLPILGACAPMALPGRPSVIVRTLLAFSIAWSLAVQLIGAFIYPASNWHSRMSPDIERHAWDFKHLILVEELRAWARGGSGEPKVDGRGPRRRVGTAPQRTLHRGRASAIADLDGDRTSDLLIYRPKSQEVWRAAGPVRFNPAAASDECVPAAADYDGDGRTDLSLFCRGVWRFYAHDGQFIQAMFLREGDLPAPGDFDGDGRAEPVVFRKGSWLSLRAGAAAGVIARTVPGNGIPVPLDYDGDGRLNPALYDRGTWRIFDSDGVLAEEIWTGGEREDIPVPGDYDGDGREDVAIFRAGAWLFFDSQGPVASKGVWTGVQASDTSAIQPAPGDYDGDGTLDLAVFAGGAWNLFRRNGSLVRGIWAPGTDHDLVISRRQHMPEQHLNR